jgi:hypothetical protein
MAADKYVLLSAWYVIHACGTYTLLCLLDTDMARAWQQGGWVAVEHLLALLVINAMLYTSLFKFTASHRSKLLEAARSSDTFFNSSLLMPIGKRHLTPTSISKQLSSGRGVVCLTVVASDVGDDTETHQEQQPASCYEAQDSSSRSQHSSRQCTCPNRHAIRVHHCRSCNMCVKGFDHHCHWLGGDVGQHNHGRFYLYLASQTSVCLCALHHTLTAVRHAAHTAWSWQIAALAGFAVLVLLAALLLLSLLAFQTFLILGNWKTYEVLRGPKLHPASWQDMRCVRGVGSPFIRGIVQNLYNFVFDRQLYDTPVDSWQLHAMAADGAPGSCWDNSMYSCC